MAKRKAKSRIFTRDRGGDLRYYADFRDINGKREALVMQGDTVATTDRVIAERLAADRLKVLQSEKRDSALHNVRRRVTLQELAAEHLKKKAQAGVVGIQHLEAIEQRLATAIKYFGPGRDPASFMPEEMSRYADWLMKQPTKRKQEDGTAVTFSGANARQYLVAMSGLFARAIEMGAVPPGFGNPVAALLEKPQPDRHEAHWLEVHDAALLLESARTHTSERPGAGVPFAYALIATLLLTGGREKEVLGIECEDISFDRGTVTFRPNVHRRLKTRKSKRTIPLWPQLRTILQAHMYGGDSPRVSGLLFPSPRTGKMIRDIRKILDGVAGAAGWEEGAIRSKMLRHTYASARIQTADRIVKPGSKPDDADPYQWVPVAVFTVSRELGHSSDTLVREVYGHLGNVQHRTDVVEYDVAQHAEELGDRLVSLADRACA